MPTSAPYISKIKLPGSDTIYEIKDAYARELINTLSGSALNYRGKVKTDIYDGCTNNSITLYHYTEGEEINGVAEITEVIESYSAVRGDIVIKDKNENNSPVNPPIEFIYDGDIWQRFGSTNEFGLLAYYDIVSGSYTPAGSVSTPTFTGTAVRLVTGNIAVPKTYTSTFTNGAVNGTIEYTPAGTITTTTATTENKTATVSKASSGTATYTPTGTISKPDISILSAGATTNLNDTYVPYNFRVLDAIDQFIGAPNGIPDDPSASPENRYSYQTKFPDFATVNTNNELLEIKSVYFMTKSANTGDIGLSNTCGNNKGNITVKTADGSYQLASTPAFTGTGVRLVTGNIAVPKTYTSTFTGTDAQIPVEDLTVTGTVTTTTATTENKTATVSKASSGTATYTPEGTISSITFTGTESNIVLNPTVQ